MSTGEISQTITGYQEVEADKYFWYQQAYASYAQALNNRPADTRFTVVDPNDPKRVIGHIEFRNHQAIAQPEQAKDHPVWRTAERVIPFLGGAYFASDTVKYVAKTIGRDDIRQQLEHRFAQHCIDPRWGQC
jgi:hypothetical protein